MKPQTNSVARTQWGECSWRDKGPIVMDLYYQVRECGRHNEINIKKKKISLVGVWRMGWQGYEREIS